MVLGLSTGFIPVKAAQNSKRPASLPPTQLQTKLTAATHAAAKAAKSVAHSTGVVLSTEVAKAEAKARTIADAGGKAAGNGLARLTAYWSSEGDYYTRHHVSSTGIRLHNGHCAVDPTIIPYGSEVQIEGLGTYLAVDTGTAVVSRRAARESGHSKAQRHALVVDLYFESRHEGEQFAANGPKFATITWWAPGTEMAADKTSSHTLIAFNDSGRTKAL
jgi:hypothetical protein